MKNIKVFALVVVLIMSFTLLAACATNEPQSSTSGSSTEAASQSSAATEETESQAAEQALGTKRSPLECGDPSSTIDENEMIENAPFDQIDWASITVGFSQMENNMPWRVAETESMQAAADKYGVKYIYADAQSDSAKQASDLEDMIAQGCDYIAVAPRVEEGLDNILKTARDAGIGVFVIDRSVSGVQAGVDYIAECHTNLENEGLAVGNWIVDALTEKYGSAKGNAVTLQGTQGATATIGRQNGFLKAIEGTDIKIIADQPAEFVLADAQAAMENILQAHGDEIDVVFCHSDEMALGAIQAIEAYGLIPGKDIIIGGVDGQGTAFEDIKNGRQNVTITCDPFYGDTVFGAIATLETGGTIPAWVIKEGQLIDSTNVEEFWDLQF